ncbi:MAG: hypothetical protein M3R24_13390, partial [Chloroflexota bacterium]|nr:hypothetical protein [Chloroflexota bacterium]
VTARLTDGPPIAICTIGAQVIDAAWQMDVQTLQPEGGKVNAQAALWPDTVESVCVDPCHPMGQKG